MYSVPEAGCSGPGFGLGTLGWGLSSGCELGGEV